ncbi:tetratricopeptide (TPR) repeat protein [Microlunatus parietis]|uniref:Tetratricopeptide (TPR) repeat protein n=1 Tax=Microlunatus parietis TaxID=682979 RepID=A0A7Y9LCC7_9ACTN|nr:tetratricopeptide (TPR) repeat protein [Microlunatus parietis]
MQILTDLLDDPSPSVLVVSGPHGIGKSTLVDAVLAEFARTPVIKLRYTPGREPFRTALDLIHGRAGLPFLDELADQLAAPADDDLAARIGRIVDRLADRLAECRDLIRPAVIVHEDVELCDPASLELCAEFLRRATLWPWSHVVVVDSAAAGRLARHPTVQLTGLDPAATAALLRETVEVPVATGVADRLARACHGNPGLLRHHARRLTPDQLAGAAPLPRRFDPPAEFVARTLDLVHDLAPGELIPLAAFDDHERIPAQVLDRLADAPEAVARLCRRGLIRAERDHWRPAEPVLPPAAMARLSGAERDLLHRRAEAGFAAIGDEPAALLHRCRLGPLPPETADRLIMLAVARYGRGDLDRAARLLARALDQPRCAESPGFRALRARVLLEQGYARAALAEAAAGLRAGPDPRSELWLRVTGLAAAVLAGVDEPTFLTADDIPPRYAEPAEEHAWLALHAAHLLALTGATREARLVLGRADVPPTATAELAALRRIVAELITGGTSLDPADLSRLAAAPAEPGRRASASLTAGIAGLLVAGGRVKTARRLVGQVLADPNRHTVLTVVHLTSALLAIDLWEGNYQVAERRLQELERSYPASAGLAPFVGPNVRIRAALDRPYQPTQAAKLRPRLSGTPAVASFDADLGFGHLVAGRYESAAICLDAALRAGQPLHQGRADVLADLVEALVALGRPGQAAAAVRRAADRAAERDCPRTAALMARCHALTADHDAVAAAGERALDLCTEAVPDLDRARTLIATGRALLMTGEVAAAQPWLGDGRELMSHLGLSGWVRHVDGLVRPQPQVVVPQRSDDPWRRVVRERDRSLLTGVAAGLTHEQLARDGYISRRTVANRLKALYELAGVTSKSELTALILRNPPPWIADRRS